MNTKTYNKYIFISLLILIPIVFLGYFAFQNVFGSTTLGVTIKTNPDLERGLVGHWTFDADDVDISSDTVEILDRSASGNNGDWQNHASTTVPGTLGQAISFDGVDDNIPISTDTNLENLSNVTVAAWVNPKTMSSGGNTVFAKGYGHFGSILGGWVFYLRDGSGSNNSLTFDAEFSGTDLIAASIENVVFENTWTHVAATWDGSTDCGNVTYYVNGEEIATKAGCTSGTGSRSGDGSYNPRIARNNNSASTIFDGSIDDVRVYDRILSAAEINRLYGLGATTKVGVTIDANDDLKNGLVLHASFDGKHINLASTTGEVIDSAGQLGFDGNLESPGTYSEFTSGVIGQAIDFVGPTAGTGQGVQFDDDPLYSGLAAVTASAWIRPEVWLTAGGDCSGVCQQIIVGKTNYASNREWRFRFEDTSDQLEWHLSTDGSATTEIGVDVTVIPENKWTHVVGWWDGNESRIYVNGVERASTALVAGSLYDGTADLGIGDSGDAADTQDNWNGGIDDVRVYNRALTVSEINRLYQLGATTKIAKTITSNDELENGLVGHWTFDAGDVDISSTTGEIRDRTSNGLTLDWRNHATTTLPGKIGQAIDFDGTDVAGTDYMMNDTTCCAFDFTTAADYSFAMWIKPKDFTEWSTLLHVTDSIEEDGIYIFSHSSSDANWGPVSNGISVGWAGNAKDTVFHSFDNVVSTSTWHHIAATIDGSEPDTSMFRIFVDGVDVTDTGDVFDNSDPEVIWTEIIQLGQNDLGDSESYGGQMDDVRIYDRELSDEEIQRLYQLGQ